MKRKVEIMAPAGSFESLAAAIKAGADSVYFGAGNLNMRSRSSANFSLDDLKTIAGICSKAGVQSYLTLNTIIYDHEYEQAKAICDTAKACGINAVIASDIAVIQYAFSIGLPVHISVQANVCNIQAVKFYSQYADIMVLARELTLPQIKGIIAAIKQEKITGPSGHPVRIELFAHGALCVSVSGKCYMSLGVYNASANRGACFQNCRRKYRLIDEDTGDELLIDNHYIMSPKDICTITVLDQLLDAGVSILKLEGRGRSSDYVMTVTGVYKAAAEAWRHGTFTKDKVDEWLNELGTVFNRGFWQGGYYLGEKLGEWSGSGGNRASRLRIELGRISKFFTKIKIAELELTAGSLSVGQEVLITGNTTGAVKFKVQEIRLEGNNVQTAEKGSVVSIPVPEKVRMNDKIYWLKTRKFGEAVKQK